MYKHDTTRTITSISILLEQSFENFSSCSLTTVLTSLFSSSPIFLSFSSSSAVTSSVELVSTPLHPSQYEIEDPKSEYEQVTTNEYEGYMIASLLQKESHPKSESLMALKVS
ncbi:hypothetical protein PanWU01x14_301820 [Parasponia andersonii]|uniref:Uncharacterized protein n=1 Tax=Parasponia andersonii TaxID=3476 RepID=A0A2P5ATK1_PARAD|nr:hypothetical protein PanWU01x14_301820 [Parasponia andersonii]